VAELRQFRCGFSLVGKLFGYRLKTDEVFPSHHPAKLRKSGFLTCEVSKVKSVAELRQFRCGFSLVG